MIESCRRDAGLLLEPVVEEQRAREGGQENDGRFPVGYLSFTSLLSSLKYAGGLQTRAGQ